MFSLQVCVGKWLYDIAYMCMTLQMQLMYVTCMYVLCGVLCCRVLSCVVVCCRICVVYGGVRS